MRTLTFLAALLAVSALSAEEKPPEQQWFYRGGGLAATNENSLGRAGEVVTYTLSTPDQVEDVVKWYGDRFGLPQKHTLVLAADAGFASLENDLHGDWQVYRDTDKQQHATLVTADASAEHAHVTFYRRLEFDSLRSVTVSISRTRKGTSIVVIYPRPLPAGQAKPAVAEAQADSLPAEPARADEPPTAKRWPLEGELKVHPKYLYRYYVVFGDGQKCALYGSDHRRDIKQLSGVEPGARVRVQGVLGTEFFPGGAAENPSPFGPAWVLYMDVNGAEIVAQGRKAAAPTR